MKVSPKTRQTQWDWRNVTGEIWLEKRHDKSRGDFEFSHCKIHRPPILVIFIRRALCRTYTNTSDDFSPRTRHIIPHASAFPVLSLLQLFEPHREANHVEEPEVVGIPDS